MGSYGNSPNLWSTEPFALVQLEGMRFNTDIRSGGHVMEKIGIVGFGEAAQAFVEGWDLGPGRIAAYDVKSLHPGDSVEVQINYERSSVHGGAPAGAVLADAEIVFCLVPTDQSTNAAVEATAYLMPGAVWIDGSSSSPGTKQQSAQAIASAGGRYVDMAIMAPVRPRLHRTPVLLSGPAAEDALGFVSGLGMNAEVVGSAIGQASTIKMLRSVIVKGMESLSAECFLAARRAGVESMVLESLASSDGQNDWSRRTSYNLGRMIEHGERRAAEMREVVATLTELGLPSWMSEAAARWQDNLAGVEAELSDGDFAGNIDRVLANLG